VSLASRLGPCALLALACAGGCRHAPTGTAAVAFVDADRNREPTVYASRYRMAQGRSVFVEARPIGPLAIPAYPPAALAAHAGTVVLHVNIAVGKDGLVGDLSPNRLAVDVPTRFDGEFLGAIRKAVAQWRFEPAQIARLEPGPGDAPIVVDSRDVETTLGIAFTFSSSRGTSSSGPGVSGGR
jgi:hypothetical protein